MIVYAIKDVIANKIGREKPKNHFIAINTKKSNCFNSDSCLVLNCKFDFIEMILTNFTKILNKINWLFLTNFL